MPIMDKKSILKNHNGEAVIWDAEITAWEGSLTRDWSGPNEYKEIFQVGALKIEADSLRLIEAREWLVTPIKNPELSDYIIELTGIEQDRVDREGISFAEFLPRFTEWIGERPIYSHNRDEEEIELNCELNGLEYPLRQERCFDIKDVFAEHGFDVSSSGKVMEVFGKEVTRRRHNALNDSLNLLDGLRELKINTT